MKKSYPLNHIKKLSTIYIAVNPHFIESPTVTYRAGFSHAFETKVAGCIV